MIQFLLLVLAMTVVSFLLILTPSFVDFAFGDTSDGTNQEFDLDPFEKVPIPDQNQDSTIFGDSEPFGTEDKGNYFMDLYSIQTGPQQVEFGHVFEDPNAWEQRYEKKDHENRRYQHVPKKDHYDFAYKRGNDHHVKEHYEKAAPHEGHFRTQARWGDKHGGYGEQYWDYNHGGDGHNEGAGNEEINGEFSGNMQTPSVIPVSSNLDSRGYDIYENRKSTSAKPNYPIQKWKKSAKKSNYDDTYNRKHKFGSTTEGTPFTTNDAKVFVLPKVRPTTFYSPVDEQPTRTTKDDASVDVDLYEQLRNLPSIYDQYREMNPTAPMGQPSSKLFPSQKSRYNYENN